MSWRSMLFQSRNPSVRQRLPILALGFRPFFLAAGVWAVLALAVWLGRLQGWLPGDTYYGGTTWHAHEMLFGYGTAVFSGFLLTATRNWTGMPTAAGVELGTLVLLWLAARLGPLLGLPGALSAALDLAFLPALALSLFKPLWQGPNRANRAFLALIAGMTLASLLVHLETLGLVRGTARVGDRLMLGLLLLVLLIVAGRVMPFFTQGGVAGARPRPRRAVEWLTYALAVPFVLTDAFLPGTPSAGVLGLALALVQGVRLAGWHDRRAWGIPILAVLYWGYVWLILGLALSGLAHLGLIAGFPALHALTVGAVGVFTLGMMVRVTLGHTGRPMVAPRLSILAFWLINLAALTRVAGPLLWPAWSVAWWTLSGVLWVLAFAAFLGTVGPMLVSSRADGQPG
jgi:uncharacterized protein involved in response to NO